MRDRPSPQDKKKNSYAKDRRNTYGERGSNSRHAIRENKLHAERSRRRADNQTLHQVESLHGEEGLSLIENKLKSRPASRKHFQKSPDSPLGEVVAQKLAGRQAHRDVAAEPAFSYIPSGPPRRSGSAQRSRLDLAEVQVSLTAGGGSGRTNYQISMVLQHGPTGLTVAGHSVKGDFTRRRAAAARQQLCSQLLAELEMLVAERLRVRGGNA